VDESKEDGMKRHVVAALLTAGLMVAGIVGAAGAAHAGPVPHLAGGGWATYGEPNERVEFGVDLPCPGEGTGVGDPNIHPTLELRWADNSFRLMRVDSAECSSNVHMGSGVGTCGDEAGIEVNWRFTDGGREGPREGRADMAEVMIGDPGILPPGPCRLSLDAPLGGGNIQMIGDPNL
jgi:hypothetical protein